MWYNIDTEREAIKMKFRVYFENGRYFPTYFKTLRAAVEFQESMGGTIQKKIGGEWYNH